MSYSQSWLEDQASIRAIFIELTVYDVVAATEIQIYVSNVGFTTSDSSISFDPCVNGNSVAITEAMSMEGGLSFSFGDIEIQNPTGEKDSWLDSSKYVWVNRPIAIWLGDPLWVATDLADLKNDFLKIFDGLIADIDSKSRNTLNIKVRDKLERLNTPITEEKIGTYGTWAGGQTNQDTIKPLIFGEVHNIEPTLIDPATLEYMFNTGDSERLIELRDNGVPIYTDPTLTSGATVSLSTGKFALSYPLAGQLTASVQGVKRSIDLTTGSEVSTYSNNIANIIALIVLKYGKVGVTNLASTDIDLTNFSSFASSNTQKVGRYINDRENMLAVCQELADSIGAQLYFNRSGQLQLLRLGQTYGGAIITDDEILFDTLSISGKSTVIAGNTIAYCKNWTVQENLLTGIPEAHKALFAQEWLTKSYTDSSVKSRYKLTDTKEAKQTLLLVGSEASDEANRLTTYFKTPRTIYRFVGTAKLLSLTLGQGVTLIHNRFNLYNNGSGVGGQVYSITPDWVNGKVNVEVII